MRTRLTFWKIFLAGNVGEDVKLSLIYTLGWLGLKDSQGVRFLAAVRAQLSCIVLSSWVLLQLFSLSWPHSALHGWPQSSLLRREAASQSPLQSPGPGQSRQPIRAQYQHNWPIRGRPHCCLLAAGAALARPGALLSLLAPDAGEYVASVFKVNLEGHPS